MDPTGSAAGSSASKEETAIDEAEKVIFGKSACEMLQSS